jgi:eukaryotic-like serine/threonine-protein kinase
MSLWRELRRRNVFKVGAAYAIVGWLLMQIASVAFGALRLPSWTVTFVTALIVIGFPIALLLAWAYEVTPDGIKRTQDVPLTQSFTELKGQRLNYIVTALLVVAVAFMAVDNYLPGVLGHDSSDAIDVGAPATDSISFVIQAPETGRFTLAQADPHPAVSPDGRRLAFIARIAPADPVGLPDTGAVLWVQTLGELRAQPLPGTVGAGMPFWSPDGRFVGYGAPPGRLERIAADGGGAPRELATNASGFGGTWSGDGTIVYSGIDGLYSVSAEGGQPMRVTSIDEAHGEAPRSHRFPVLLPDGRRFLYFVQSSQRGAQGLYVGSLDDPTLKQRIVATDANGALGLGPDGQEYLFFVRDYSVIAQPFDLATATLSGEPLVVAPSIEPAQSMRFAPFTAGGRSFVYRPRFSPRTRLNWVDRHGVHGESIGNGASSDGLISLSPDGMKLASTRLDRQTNTNQVWWIDLGRNVEERLTSSSDGGYFPIWTPDSERIVYASPRAALWNVYSRPIVGSSSEDTVIAGPVPVVKYPRDITRDGRYLVFEGSQGNFDLWLLPLKDSGEARPLIATPAVETTARVSPDGHWIAFTSLEAGEPQVYVSTFPSGTERRRVSTAAGADPQWRADGRELYYLSRDNVLMAVAIGEGEDFAPSVPEPLFRFEPNPLAVAFGSSYAPAPDGQRFVISELVGPAQPQLVATLNWQTD